MDRAIAAQFGQDHFVTVQMVHLDVTSGCLRWVNAGARCCGATVM